MKNNKLIGAVLAVVILVGGVAAFTAVRNQPSKPEVKAAVVQVKAPATLQTSADGKVVNYQGQTGKTALAVLQSLAKVETKSSSYGDFVVGINGVTADGTKEFWSFYVNGKLADQGAGTYQSKDSDKIEWKVESVTQ